MKILYHHRIGSRDGQAVHMDELIAALRERGHEVLVVGPRSISQASFGHDPKLVNALKRNMPRSVYEILELGYNAISFVRLSAAYMRFRPDVFYERANLYTIAGALLSKLGSAPYLLEVNAPLAAERSANGGLAFPNLARFLEAWTWKRATYALPVTDVLAEHLV